METKKKTIDGLTEGLHDFLRSLPRSEGTIKKYLSAWKKLKAYMALHDQEFYTADIGEAFLASELGRYEYQELPSNKKRFVSKIRALTEFQRTGRLSLGPRKKPARQFYGAIGKTMEAFIGYRTRLYQLSRPTITNYNIYLHSLLRFLSKGGVDATDKVELSDILRFIDTLDPTKPAARHISINILRNYLRYLYEERLIIEDLSKKIPSDNYKGQSRLPSTFSKDEIDRFIKAIDRASPKGKRDYAIFLLALKLGMRISDIAGLRFEHISWQRNEFVFEQQKTGKGTILPILPEIGNAIIDYLRYGRPVSKEKHCFLQVIPPYNRIVPHDIGNCVRSYLGRAGIALNKRRHGPHALRHSFAAAMLEKATPLPIISEALGHSSSKSTMFYLRIDVSSLKQCALEVPHIPFSFYAQKGGYDV